VVPLARPAWSPPGVDPHTWRMALAEDVVDLLATLAEVTPAVAVAGPDQELAESLVWPGTPVYPLPALTLNAILAAAATDGYQQAAVIAPDAPDLPAMLIGKLLRPLSTRPVAVAPAATGGLLGLAARVPAPDWLPELDLSGDPAAVRAAAPRAGLVAVAPGWHRLSGPEGLSRLDPGLEGWAATRALLAGQPG
jgi:molybdopterin-guanine dinucleotide biosynthesis protein A